MCAPATRPRQGSVVLTFGQSAVEVQDATLPRQAFQYSWVKILEMGIALARLGDTETGSVGFQFSLWRDGLPVDAVPQHGWLELKTTDPDAWGP